MGVHGQVLLGPQCPVEREDSPCPDRLVTGSVVATPNDVGVPARARTDTMGRFRLGLAYAGTYTVTAEVAGALSCEEKQVYVQSGRYTPLTITCDTGIR